MLPHHMENCAHLFALAKTISNLIADETTPKPLRRLLVKLLRKLRRKLPATALREIEAAEAEATVKASRHLRFDSR